MKLHDAYAQGVRNACMVFKVSSAMGADAGVMPKGDEQSHGTERLQYPKRTQGQPTPDENSAAVANMPDWLWDNFTTYDAIAPGRADGSYGQETIG